MTLKLVYEKLCPKCRKTKNNFEFNKDSTRKDGLDYYCIDCRNLMRKEQKEVRRATAIRYREKNKEALKKSHRDWSYTGSGVYSSLSKNAKKRGILVEMSRRDFDIWWNLQEQVCHYCGIPFNIMQMLDWSRGNRRMSIDRMNNDMPYRLDNIVLSCMKCNTLKGDIITYTEMKNIIGPLMRTKWEILL